jgi:hypothetical protein
VKSTCVVSDGITISSISVISTSTSTPACQHQHRQCTTEGGFVAEEKGVGEGSRANGCVRGKRWLCACVRADRMKSSPTPGTEVGGNPRSTEVGGNWIMSARHAY